MPVAWARVVRRDFQILEMFSERRQKIYFCVHQKLEHGCIKAHSQQIWGSGEFRCPVNLVERSLEKCKISFFSLITLPSVLHSCCEARAKVLAMEILSLWSKSFSFGIYFITFKHKFNNVSHLNEDKTNAVSKLTGFLFWYQESQIIEGGTVYTNLNKISEGK